MKQQRIQLRENPYTFKETTLYTLYCGQAKTTFDT
mgnify:CR=1 FL=1